MLYLDVPPVVAQPCDTAARLAEIDRIEDQAFAAMKRATEQVAEAARAGATGTAGDAEWTTYKQLRARAELLRAQRGECPTERVNLAPPPVTAPPATPAATTLAARDLPARDWAPSSGRFRFEAGAYLADAQPSAASRLGVETVSGVLFQNDGLGSFSPTPSGPPPAFQIPAPTITGALPGTVTNVSPVRDGPRPHVRSWSSGQSLALSFAPQGQDVDGWRWTARLTNGLDKTKSDTTFAPINYVVTGTPTVTYGCGGSFISLGQIQYYQCGYRSSTPLSLDRYLLVNNLINGETGRRTVVSADNLTQTSKRLDGGLELARDFTIASPLGALTASAGAEIGFGWWTIEERESIRSDFSYDFYRSADGPTAMIGLTGQLGGPVWRAKGLRWSVRSGLGYQVADLTATERLQVGDGYTTGSTVQNLSDEMVGRLGARLDFLHGPVGMFLAVDRRRDLSLVSTVTAPGANGRASKLFDDGTSVSVWPVYSSRLTFGVNYGF